MACMTDGMSYMTSVSVRGGPVMFVAAALPTPHLGKRSLVCKRGDGGITAR